MKFLYSPIFLFLHLRFLWNVLTLSFLSRGFAVWFHWYPFLISSVNLLNLRFTSFSSYLRFFPVLPPSLRYFEYLLFCTTFLFFVLLPAFVRPVTSSAAPVKTLLVPSLPHFHFFGTRFFLARWFSRCTRFSQILSLIFQFPLYPSFPPTLQSLILPTALTPFSCA